MNSEYLSNGEVALSSIKLISDYLSSTASTVLPKEDQMEIALQIFLLYCKVAQELATEVTDIAETMRHLSNEIWEINALGDEWYLNVPQSTSEEMYKFEKAFMIMENKDNINLTSLSVPHKYLTDPNWKEKYRQELEFRKNKNIEYQNKHKETQELALLAELKAKYEK